MVPEIRLQRTGTLGILPALDPIVQWPRTPPFHGGNTGSNPVRVASIYKAGNDALHNKWT